MKFRIIHLDNANLYVAANWVNLNNLADNVVNMHYMGDFKTSVILKIEDKDYTKIFKYDKTDS